MAERAAKQLELNKSELPNSITEVIATLTRAGFDAYIVGGGVRDTLLGLRPKDFDAVTDAKPHEIKDVFGKRCRIIGRRFQLAHVYSGRELIEVATFRGPPTNNANTNQDGMILRDNVWGDIKQDFARRDFSINALYYQPLKGVVHDFCGALDDIDNRIIRLLGHAPTRIEEDPVRLLRALRFKAKLGFEFDEALAEQFHEDNWALLEQISPHRLYDETQKMFTGGYLVPLLPLLFESGAMDSLVIYPPAEPSALVKQVAINTDKRIAAGKSINPAFFYAALLWENYLHQLEKAKKRNMPFADAQLHAAGKVIDRQRIKTAIPKFAEQFIRDIWILQPKLSAPRNKQIVQLSEHPRFRAGFDFLLLREQCGDAEHPLSESTNGMGEWWQTYQTLSTSEQQQAIDAFDENIRRGAYKKSQRSRGRNRQNQKSNSSIESVTDTASSKPSNAPQKDSADTGGIPARRRRAKSQPATSKSNNQPNSKSSAGRHDDNQSLSQDEAELAQLQQLSLAAIKQSHKKPAAPKPLFVIEHEAVVPPLKKQLPQDKEAQSAAQDKQQAAPKQPQKRPQKESKAQVESSSTTQQTPSAQAVSRDDKPSAVASVPDKPALTVAQSPALVSLNNAPIPYKRRRRQPSSTATTTKPQATDASEQTPAKPTKAYTKQAPKPAVQSTTEAEPSANRGIEDRKAATAKKTSAPSASKKIQTEMPQPLISLIETDKGPIPAKRRRRQPSAEDT
ncbi:polynucleotide adenylyltransferase PcnB [Psychrobacter sp. CAM01]|uniref:polynucleotide adenylyltransferase PcnB n=1 Tax=Psychrobacter sp. CAM01 TaxID=3080335 RepID=UPI002935FF37|nr:polynucleotide adenylyltransferase PcnB [Psychrobacter sp. CAM01]MDV2859456.1 polynucleotide adenylyltransferase PcnB [Psychrobacter sp. CAM01]